MLKPNTGVAQVIIFLAAMLFALPSFAQEERIYELDTVIVVTAARAPSTFSDLARSVIVIGRSEIEAAPVRSVDELLARALGVDVRRRGTSGVQADVSIRGGTFEQTLFLIDGIKVSDPQTGHHNLDLPVALADIERIEVLKGPGSKLYGPNAMGGVVNIITRQAADELTHVEIATGDFGLFERLATLSYPLGITTHRLTLGRMNSTGYRSNTEFDATTFGYSARVLTGAGPISFSARYLDKEFGAYRFYSDLFADEWEATKTLFLSADAKLGIGRAVLSPKLFWRRHKDDFILDRNRPEWYRNRHTTDQYGVELLTSLTSFWGVSTLGAELAGEEIKSTNLGSHFRTRGGLFFEMSLTPIAKLVFVPGATVYHYTNWGWNIWPGIDMGYQLSPHARLFFTVGKSFRVPTYTELHYQSPANIGNPDLQPEKSWTYEIGTRLWSSSVSASLSTFVRKGTDLIDWARHDPKDPWQVLNVTHVTTRGVEIGAATKLNEAWSWSPVTDISARYTFLDSKRTAGDCESKYVLDHLRHQVVVDVGQRWSASVRQSWNLRYLKRLQGDDYFVIDTRLSWRVGKVKLFAEATNLLDTPYTELGTVPTPGRWLRAGLWFDSLLD
ncbi:MAG: TonB-dependent receptor [candidate division Zixibacteria bacterium]|nr:TonB-dependent receptor [candidate division Zixibacteria bacterium]